MVMMVMVENQFEKSSSSSRRVGGSGAYKSSKREEKRDHPNPHGSPQTRRNRNDVPQRLTRQGCARLQAKRPSSPSSFEDAPQLQKTGTRQRRIFATKKGIFATKKGTRQEIFATRNSEVEWGSATDGNRCRVYVASSEVTRCFNERLQFRNSLDRGGRGEELKSIGCCI